MPLAPTHAANSQQAERARALQDVLATLRIESLELDDRAAAIFQRYVDGELTLTELGAAVDELNDREFGPVHLSRDQRP